ncbi:MULTISPECIES: hypothetical protein [unclassified Streptomyces]|uniref:hypothetical protein n=1 Tax=unclassified Streptomyces TaxID=2593676 RepID=UPI0036667BA5
MSSPTTKATAIASMLTSALSAPADNDDPGAVRVEETDAALRIWAPVPAALSEAVCLAVLVFLQDTADRFGHTVPRTGPSVIWAEIQKSDTGRAPS